MCLLAGSLSQAQPGEWLLLLQSLLLSLSNGIHLQPITVHQTECQQSGTEVTCRGQSLPTLPEDLQPDVKVLDVSQNAIHTLTERATARLHALKHLNISYNGLDTIEDGAFRGVSQLHSLILASNFLDRKYLSNGRAFRSLQSLRILDLSANNLDGDMVAYYLSNTTSLEELNLSWNKIEKLSSEVFHGAPQLQVVRLANSYVLEIKAGTFEALTGLRVLDLAMNHLNCITSFSLLGLRVLNLSSNALELFLTDETEEQYKLQVLDLSQNRLLHFPVLPKWHHIQHLNLSGNAMAALTPSLEDAGEDSGTALWYSGVSRRDLSRAILSRMALSQIRHLDISHNQLTSFPVHFLHNLNFLQNLNMGMNCLQEIIPDAAGDSTSSLSNVKPLARHEVNLESLRVLDLYGNGIQVLPRWLFEATPKLETINLAQNSIVPCVDRSDLYCTSFSDLVSLKHLSLRGNGITSLSPYMFNQTTLISLDISANEGLIMSRNSLGGLELSLQKLSLRGNQLDSSEIDFPCLKTLKALDLSSNQLDFLPPSLECSPLESLDIRNNNLETVENRVAMSLPRTLTSLLISGNPFNCCSLTWLESLQVSKVRVLDLAEAKCVLHSENGSVPARIDSDHRGLCPPPVLHGYPDVLLVVGLILFIILLCGICFLLKKGRHSKSLRIRGNRVASTSIQPSIEKRIEGNPADTVTKL